MISTTLFLTVFCMNFFHTCGHFFLELLFKSSFPYLFINYRMCEKDKKRLRSKNFKDKILLENERTRYWRLYTSLRTAYAAPRF